MAREALFNSDSLIDEPCEAEIWDKSLSQRGYTKLKSARSIRFSRVTKELLGEALINKGSIVLRFRFAGNEDYCTFGDCC